MPASPRRRACICSRMLTCKLRRETDFGGSALEVAGYLAPEHRNYLHGIERRMKDAGLDHEFRYRGMLDRPHKIDFLRNLDVLCVPATYDEPKGMFLLEAMANGVPVIEPRAGRTHRDRREDRRRYPGGAGRHGRHRPGDLVAVEGPRAPGESREARRGGCPRALQRRSHGRTSAGSIRICRRRKRACLKFRTSPKNTPPHAGRSPSSPACPSPSNAAKQPPSWDHPAPAKARYSTSSVASNSPLQAP